jgi:hypothetical protein
MLDAATLQVSLTALMTNHPATSTAAAAAWASAFCSYAASVVPATTSAPAAQAALTTALTAAFAAPSGLAAMASAFTAAAATLAAGIAVGVAGPTGFAAVPPPVAIDWATLLALPYATTAGAAAAKVATAIHAWMLTGTASVVAPPGPTLLWS